MDRGEVTSLILLDLPAAFDTVDHSILLHRLRNRFGLNGTSLDRFPSHLTSRSQAQSPSKIPLHLSQIFLVVYLYVPSLAHFFNLYALYITPFGSVISKNSTKYHFYVDDTQFYISVTPSNLTISLEILSNNFSYVLSWMNSNKLLLNSSTTEFLLVGTKTRTTEIFSTPNFIS